MRIVSATGLIGYANTATERMMLSSCYQAVLPFVNDRARVGNHCQMLYEAEHSMWSCGQWQYIDHQGWGGA